MPRAPQPAPSPRTRVRRLPKRGVYDRGQVEAVLDAGLVVREVPCDLHHRVTGTDWRAQLHRAAQYRDVALALGIRRLRRSRQARRSRRP